MAHRHKELISRLRSTPDIWLHEVAQILEDQARSTIVPGSDFSIGTLFAMLGNQLRRMKSRREFSLMFTRFQEAEMWYRLGLQEIELDQKANDALVPEEPTILEDLVSLVKPVYRPGQRHGVAESFAAMLYFAGVPGLEALNFMRMIMTIFTDPEDRSPVVISTYANLANQRGPSFPGIVGRGVSYEKYNRVFERLKTIYGGKL